MNQLIYANVIIVLAIANVQSLDNVRSKRLVQGENANQNLAPWQVLFVQRRSDAWLLCGGSLLNKEWVLTAGHCCDEAIIKSNLQIANYIKYGNLNHTIMPFQSNISQMIIHPQYERGTHSHNLCLCKLAIPARESSTVKFATLATSYPPSGARAIVTGWGNTNSTDMNSGPDMLLYAQHIVIDQARCEYGMQRYGGHIDGTNICTLPTKQSLAWGDSGNPLAVNGQVVGVASTYPSSDLAENIPNSLD
ncbi:unnamed protein product [Oppiella nova]|uniref:Peptidase S1 domain-containing protein n=1 Tax=Oppiella nova TaxID=334625 RepID=A0A7R9LY23_9ACAR|nr:unnamed protein product [Oppiella nova]CAG2168113.1 unnamed protein product [Oppiella nova]